jgi:hypothetical protein
LTHVGRPLQEKVLKFVLLKNPQATRQELLHLMLCFENVSTRAKVGRISSFDLSKGETFREEDAVVSRLYDGLKVLVIA